MIDLDSQEYFKYYIDSDLVYSRKISTENLPEEFSFDENFLVESSLKSISSNTLDETNLPQETDPAGESPCRKEIPEGKPIEDSPGEQVPLD